MFLRVVTRVNVVYGCEQGEVDAAIQQLKNLKAEAEVAQKVGFRHASTRSSIAID